MKRIFSGILILMLLTGLCGCKRENLESDSLKTIEGTGGTISAGTEPSGSNGKQDQVGDKSVLEIGPKTPKDLVPGEQPPINFESVEQIGEDRVTRYEDQDLSKLPHFKDTMSVRLPVSTTYEDLMKWVGEDGLIVAGYATGIREGHRNGAYTLTDFKIQKAYFGNSSTDLLKVQESFVAISEEGRNYIYYSDDELTCLKNDQMVLLCLAETETTGIYWPVYYEIPLPADYQSYDEAYLSDFLDFYRGKHLAYQYSSPHAETVYQTNPDGTVQVIDKMYSVNYWPEREISNEALIEEMSEHILVRLVTEYQIKIWPYGHKEYAANGLPENAVGLKILSKPTTP